MSIAVERNPHLKEAEAVLPSLLADYVSVQPYIVPGSRQTANRKIVLENMSTDSRFFRFSTLLIGAWALKHEVTVLTAVPYTANRFVKAAADRYAIPFVGYKNRGDVVEARYFTKNAKDLLADTANPQRIGIVDGVRMTGAPMLKVARTEVVQGHTLLGLAIVDRGEDVAGIETSEEADAYNLEHLDLTPAHMKLPFSCDALLSAPLAQLVGNLG
jgi:hypothetical protein